MRSRSIGRSACIRRCSSVGADSARLRAEGDRRRAARRRARPRSAFAWDETVIYEAEPARLHPAATRTFPRPRAARFAGLAHPGVDRASARGSASPRVEIMPADAFVDERHLPPLGLTNAWGYNPVVLGAPDPRLAPGGWAEVRARDRRAARGGPRGRCSTSCSTTTARATNSARRSRCAASTTPTYFRLLPDDPARYINDMGCGNCLALDRPPVVAMAIAALRRWMMRAASTASVSISRPRSAGATGASTRTRRCLRRSPPTRCCRRPS